MVGCWHGYLSGARCRLAYGQRDSEWQWHQLGQNMQVCTSLHTDNHANTTRLNFLQAGCPSCHPTNSVKALKAAVGISTTQCIFPIRYSLEMHLNCPFLKSNAGSHLINTWFLGPNRVQCQYPKWHLSPFSLFCRVHGCDKATYGEMTDRHTQTTLLL